MNLMSTSRAAQLWGISQTRVSVLAKSGRIPGAIQVGMRWMIPENAEKPADGRAKATKPKAITELPFRFPIYLNREEQEYLPPLSHEERTLRLAQIDFYSCLFDDADAVMKILTATAKNPYVRISALMHRCLLTFILKQGDEHKAVISEFLLALENDFQYVEELRLMKHLYNIIIGSYNSINNDFYVNPNYKYHGSSTPLLCALSALTLNSEDIGLIFKLRFDHFEALCQCFEAEGHYFEEQLMHLLLLFSLQAQGNTVLLRHHLKRVLEIANERELYFFAAIGITYYPDELPDILADFSDDFYEKLKGFSKKINEGYVYISEYYNLNPLFAKLSSKDYRFVFLATQGYTNKEISKMLNTSEGYISKRYREISDKLEVKNKKEIVARFISDIGAPCSTLKIR